jgi:hypothetical protein
MNGAAKDAMATDKSEIKKIIIPILNAMNDAEAGGIDRSTELGFKNTASASVLVSLHEHAEYKADPSRQVFMLSCLCPLTHAVVCATNIWLYRQSEHLARHATRCLCTT